MKGTNAVKILKRILAVFLAVVSTAAPSLCLRLRLPRVAQGQTLDLSKFTMTWNDEFDGDRLDRAKWGNSWWETVRKGGYWHEDMVSVEDGDLVIRAEYLDEPLENYYYEKWHDKINFDPYKPGYYTGEIDTRGKFEQCYGYFECRCILPAGRGLWSAFWMMNDGVYNADGSGRDGTEIDVFESFYYGQYKYGNDRISANLHYDGYGDAHVHSHVATPFVKGDPYKEYNTYGVEWNPDEYIFYINGKEFARSSAGGVSQNAEFLLLSVEVAGENGVPDHDKTARNGDISDTPQWPAEFRVDYVRCYQYNELL